MKKKIESNKLLSAIIFFLSISLLLIFNTPFAMAEFFMQDSFNNNYSYSPYQFSSNIITDQYSFWGDITRYSSSYGNQGGSYNNFFDSHIGGWVRYYRNNVFSGWSWLHTSYYEWIWKCSLRI